MASLLVREAQASWVGTEVRRRLGSLGQSAAVHSAYRGAVNVVSPLGLISLVPRSAGRSPSSITLANNEGIFAETVAGDPVHFDGSTLEVAGRFVVPLRGCPVYDPPKMFARQPLDPQAVSNNLRLTRQAIITRGRLTGMGFLMSVVDHPAGFDGSILSGLNRAALRPAMTVLEAVATGDVPMARRATAELSGIGIGLTPAGDDFLAGVMVALVMGSWNGAASRSYTKLVRGMLKAVEGRTTILSQEQLIQSANGRGSESVTQAVEAVYTGTEGDVQSAIDALLQVGHTSGTDIATGIYLGIAAAMSAGRSKEE